ncbi:MAG: hypothetical protein R6W78_09510 [Bacteroidales bacterium]
MERVPNIRLHWNMAFLLMGFVFINHLLVIISFLTSAKVLPVVFPLSFLIASFLSIYLGKRDGFCGIKLYLPTIISFILIIFSMLFSTQFFDFTFDGQWYHHSAIYKLESGWNAFLNPLDEAHKSILHFPKGTWYFSASVYSTLGTFEAGKCLNIIMIAIVALMVYATSIEYKVSKFKSIVLAILVTLHPVVWSEITTFQNDNNLYLHLVIYMVAIFSWLRTYGNMSLLIGILAGVCIINIKFTGLVFLCVFAFFGFVYFLVYKQKFIFKYIGIHAIILIMGVGVFGYNPYVTNFIHRGHPFYPIMGTEEYPSHTSEGKDGNEKYETPKNMMGKATFMRFFYANFSRPSNAPYNNQINAELILPFTSKISDWNVYRFHDLRVSAFGPFFSGVLILSFVYLIFLLIFLGKNRWHLLIPVLAIFISLMLSRHFWWARFGPQLWLFPISLIFASFLSKSSKLKSILNLTMVSLIIVNGLIVLFIHLSWVYRETGKLQQHFSEIKKQGKPIEICMYWFDDSMSQKLNDWGVEYKKISMKDMKNLDETKFKELRTVVDGYPGTNRYRVLSNNE